MKILNTCYNAEWPKNYTGRYIYSVRWVELTIDFGCSKSCFAWADRKLAEQLGKRVEHPNQSQPNPTHVRDVMPHPVTSSN